MDCESIQMLLPPLVRGGVDPDTQREVRAHLAHCADCRERLSQLEADEQTEAHYPPPPRATKLKRMTPRWTIVIAASLLGAAVLLAAFLFGGEGPPREDRRVTDPGQVHAPPVTEEALGPRRIPLEGSGVGFAELIGEDGKQLTELAWQSSTRRPLGVQEVQMPAARIHMIPYTRVLQIQAMEGTFNLPDDQVRGGRLRRNVVLTLFDAPPGRLADLSNDSPDIRLRLFLDEADFDLDLGIIESNSPVHATSARFDFRGMGLRLNYTPAANRIDRLEIVRGQQLRLKGEALAEEDASDSRTASRDGDGDGDASDRADDEADVFYRATLSNEVRIENPDTTITADQLALLFALTDNEVRDEVFDEPEERSEGQTSRGKAEASPASPPVSLQRGIPQPPAAASMLEVSPDDLRITWRGSLVVEPAETAPPQLARRDDVQLLLWGSPVRIETRGEDAFIAQAGNLSYLTRSRILELFEGLHQPVVLQSAQLGVIRGQHLAFDQLSGQSVMHGHGELTAPEEEAGPVDDPPTGDRSRLPPGLRVAWQERANFDFYRTDDSDMGIAGLKNVAFLGDVAVRHPQLQMDSGELALSLTDPAQGSQSVSGIEARHNVRVHARGKRTADDLAIDSEALTIVMQPDAEGKLRPAQMIASGSVWARQPDHELRAEHMDVQLADVSQSREGDDMLPPVHHLTAQDNVRVQLADRGVALTAHRLDASVLEEKVDLYAGEGREVHVLTRDGVLTGEHITMLQRSKTLGVHGAGTLRFALDDDDRVRDEAGPIAFNPDPHKLVSMRWQEFMRFDDLSGQAQFFGDVVADSRNDNDTTHLSTDRLFLTFAVPGSESDTEPGTIADASGPLMNRMLAGDRAIRTALADGNALFLSENWLDEPGRTLATRVRMAGPNLAFEQETEHITITGKGNMLVQDERPARDGAPAADDDARPTQFTGRGATVFTWEGSMLLDAGQNDMRLTQQVRMIHRPLGKTDVLQMDCEIFVADLEPTGGLTSWLGERGPQPALRSITAEEDVFIVAEGKEITTDHLLYTGDDQTVLLRAAAGRLTQIVDATQPAPFTAESFRWDLPRDRITIDRPGPGFVPVR